MSDILLATFNARYIHASLGLRCLLANMGDLRARTRLIELTRDQRPADAAERLLAPRPRVIGLGVYIWNAGETLALVQVLKAVAPEVIVVLGGPEVSHEQGAQPVTALADYVIAGQGDLAFAELCRRLLAGERPAQKTITPPPPPLDRVALPYAEYTDQDIAHRLVYVEASRGCPFKCEFCLSALDKTASPFDPDRFLGEMARLHERGVRHFKFVDRTFNLETKASRRILGFFIERLSEELFLHFEVIPDRLPEGLKELLVQFPPGTLQLEVGVQTFNPQVQRLISRRQNNEATEANLCWLRAHTHAHIHADLIAGLPGEDLASFAAGFDRLWALRPHEIQVGLLKRLRGAPIARHTEAYGMRYSPQPPYTLLANRHLDFATVQRLARFARYWDLVANTGRFPNTLPVLLGERPFERFLRFSDWLYGATGQTHRIALPRLFELLHRGLVELFGAKEHAVVEALACDGSALGAKGCPEFLHPYLRGVRKAAGGARQAPARQARHLSS